MMHIIIIMKIGINIRQEGIKTSLGHTFGSIVTHAPTAFSFTVL